ncbi:uncharacterized protein LOC143620187 [Bidens hawaiensis]|uniref:uncharacterized protein LOC143620187 n=1 Tax=Bidens hawaiensis TaxID=980011 RepID=UPI00404BA1AD
MTGAALQMQRELQWYKEVENFVEPSFKKARNKNKKTPKMIFMEEHNDLLNDAQSWMKDVSASSTVVAALIITMAFTGAFGWKRRQRESFVLKQRDIHAFHNIRRHSIIFLNRFGGYVSWNTHRAFCSR